MKNKLFWAVLSAIALTHTACSNDDTTTGIHQTGFLNTNPSGRLLFADQTIDTLRVASTDSWTLSLNSTNGNTSWCSATPESQDVKAGYQFITPIALSIQPNTTQEYRSLRLQLHSAYLKDANIAMPITQVPFHNITRPVALLSTTNGTQQKIPSFSEALSAKLDSTYAVFTLYNPGDTIVSDADWLKVDVTAAKPQKGKNSVLLVAQPNPEAQERTATVTLRASGVATHLVYTQAAKKD